MTVFFTQKHLLKVRVDNVFFYQNIISSWSSPPQLADVHPRPNPLEKALPCPSLVPIIKIFEGTSSHFLIITLLALTLIIQCRDSYFYISTVNCSKEVKWLVRPISLYFLHCPEFLGLLVFPAVAHEHCKMEELVW